MNASSDSRYHSIFDDSAIESVDNCEVEDLVFVLNIGKNIKKINNVMMDMFFPHVNDDGSITFFHPVVHINCSEENKHFYSEDGKLYSKRTNKLITDFAYAS